MIIFELTCERGHAFEGWFQDHESFLHQLDRNLIQCPTCGTSQVTQRLSTGGVVRGRQESAPKESGTTRQEYRAFLTAVKHVIETHFENVGPEFAKTALRIHYGVEEKKNIRGTTTEAEENMLRDEGVAFYKVPIPVTSDDSELN